MLRNLKYFGLSYFVNEKVSEYLHKTVVMK